MWDVTECKTKTCSWDAVILTNFDIIIVYVDQNYPWNRSETSQTYIWKVDKVIPKQSFWLSPEPVIIFPTVLVFQPMQIQVSYTLKWSEVSCYHLFPDRRSSMNQSYSSVLMWLTHQRVTTRNRPLQQWWAPWMLTPPAMLQLSECSNTDRWVPIC